jgi:hypothetical protein
VRGCPVAAGANLPGVVDAENGIACDERKRHGSGWQPKNHPDRLPANYHNL